MDRGGTGNHTERGASGRVRQLDSPYAVEIARPSREVANMPNIAISLSRGQELAGKIEQQLHSVGRRYPDAQGPTADQHPTMIIINGPVPKIKRDSAQITAAVIKREKKPARQASKVRIDTETRIQADHHGPDIGAATADPGERRRDDIADPLMGLRRQEARLAHRIDEARRHRVGQTAELNASPRGQLQIAAAKFPRDPAQSAKRRTGCLPARNPNPDYGPILCQMGP
jgi:hypothetical protein